MNNLESKETIPSGFRQEATFGKLDQRSLCRTHAARYKLVVFDFDGTLADSFAWFLSVINEVADAYSFRRIQEQELTKLRSYDAKGMLEHVGVPMWKIPLLQRHMRRRMTSDIGDIALFPGVAGLLQRLRNQGIALAIVTSNSFINVREVLGRLNAGLIQHYACGAPILGKRAKLRKVLHSSGVRHSEAIFIGDEIRDLHAARAEGIDFGAVSWGVNSAESLAEYFPEEIFSNVDEIAERIARPGIEFLT